MVCKPLTMNDEGCGMMPEIRARFLERLFKADGDGRRTGMGLAAVVALTSQGGGCIGVDSPDGTGTALKFYFSRGKTGSPPDQQNVSPRPGGGTETILLVEDDDAVRTLARYVLVQSGYSVLDASNGAEALRICQDHNGPIHLLLTDVVMPRMGGDQVAEAACLLRPELKVLFISGHTPDVVSRHGVAQQEDNFLSKPFGPLPLTRKVRQLLDQL